MSDFKAKLFRPFDILIILLVLTIGIVTLFSFFTDDTDISCVIKVDGKQVQCISLSQVKEDTDITVQGDLLVTVHITKQGVSVISSDCPDKICEHTGVISKAGQSIVCLPAKVSVSLVADNSAYDAVVGW